MNKKTSWLLVLGLGLSTTLGVEAWMTQSVKAQTQPLLEAQLPAASTPTKPPKPKKPEVSGDVQSQRNGIPDAVLCYSCGRYWPYYGGTIPTYPYYARELGPSCSGGFSTSYEDTTPYLCTR